MNNTNALRDIISNSGYKFRYLAEQIGLTYQGFFNKINDISKFRANEIGRLCELLKIDDETRNTIFFTNRVDGESTPTNESEE